MSQEIQTGLITLIPLLLQLLGLTFAVLTDPYIRRQHRRIMVINIALILSLVAQNYVSFLLIGTRNMILARTLVDIYGYCVRPVILVLFFHIVTPRRDFRLFWVLVALNAVIHLTALFSGICFRINSGNHFQRGPLGYSCHITSAVALIYLIYLTVREHRNIRESVTWIPLFNAALIIAAVLMDSFFDQGIYRASFLTIAVVSCSVFYYIWLHLQFVREHEQALKAEQRIQIMMSQIQPHFLFNTLSTIQALCRIDPQKAFDTTEKFGTYLRQNIDSLGQPNLIPVTKELEHTRVYAEIEEIRFPSIHVTYDTEDLDFSLPALTIQPLVENAIRHGVRIRKNGLVTVSTRRLDNCHQIQIRDNGKGFDAALAETADEMHIGIRNVRERIAEMCGGTLTIDSVIGQWTTVTIRIPAKP